MNNRRQSGAALSFIAAATLLLVLMGVCFFLLSMQMGGSRELLHATDGGSLNVAKQAIRKPDVSLSASEEEENFGGLIDKGQISLANYNRITGQTLLVALNASAENTAQARANAEKVIDVVHGSGGISAKLSNALKDSGKMEGHFLNIAALGSVRMLGADAEASSDNGSYEVAYLEEGSATNVDFDPETLPFNSSLTKISLPQGALSTEKSSKTKHSYLAGYMPIKVPGLSKAIAGVPVMPGKAPHLVSLKDFSAGKSEPQGTSIVPPNSFKSAGQAKTSHGVACSIVGALSTSFTASIPRGYIIISNRPVGSSSAALSFDGQLGTNDHIFAQELHNGVFVSPNGGGSRAFTTDEGLYNQWLNYNNAVKAGLPAGPAPSTNGVHGDPRTITAPSVMLTYHNYGANVIDPLAVEMLPKIAAAYPHENKTVAYTNNELTAVEKWKADVMAAFGRVSRLHDPTDPAFRQLVPPPAFETGLKVFGHGGTYPSPPNPVAFGKAGSIKEMLNQCDANVALAHIEQRMHQIKPEASDAEIQAVLNKQGIGIGMTMFIYKDPKSNTLTISSQKPSWAHNTNADGNPITKTVDYDLNRRSVNAAGDAGAPVYPFMHAPDAKGHDTCTFTPSSGYQNLLGTVNFSTSASVGPGGPGAGGSNAWFWDPN